LKKYENISPALAETFNVKIVTAVYVFTYNIIRYCGAIEIKFFFFFF